MKYILFLVGFFCWIDWVPYVDYKILNLFNFSINLFFIFYLIRDFKSLRFFGSAQVLIIVYLFYMLIITFFNGEFLKYSTIVNLLIIVLILSKPHTDASDVYKGFIFGGLFTSLFMFLMIFDIISISNLSALSQFNLGEYFMSQKDSLISIGLTDKYNKLSYLFSFLICFTLSSKNVKIYIKVLATLIFLFLQFKTTGRGGSLVSIIFILFLVFKSKYRFFYMLSGLILTSFFLGPFFRNIFVGSRFTSGDSLSRLFQYNYVIDNFDENIIFGIGYSPIYGLINAPYVHNFFLNHLLMGGFVGLILGVILIMKIYKLTIYSNLTSNFKFFFLIFISIQISIENFNPLTALGSYMLFWLIITNKNNNFLINKIN